MKCGAYWRLMRFNRPAGILLLWYPTAWALWMANQGHPPSLLVLLLFLGTVLMRAAGCVINDIADRHIDIHVARTQSRPLTSGEISLQEAFLLLISLLSGALIILINLPKACLLPALIALMVTFIYPFCKRYISAPQLVLGLAFSMGMPMAYVASEISMDSQFIILFMINFIWIISYDTMYAMADKADDLKIGVRSTAIYFGNYDRLIIGILFLTLHVLWLCWGLWVHVNGLFYPIWFIAGLILIYQQGLIHQRIPTDCFKSFIVSTYYGALMWGAMVVGLINN